MSEFDLKIRPALASRVRLQIDPVSGDPVLLYPEGLLILSPTAHDIVGCCDGKRTLEEVLVMLYNEYDESEEVIRRDVLETLADLKHRNLIVFSS